MKKIFSRILLLFLVIPLALVILILWLTISDFRPEPIQDAEITNIQSKVTGQRFSLFNWNLGYGGLGSSMDFFMDGGSRVRAPEDEYDRYWTGIKDYLKQTDYDVYFFQEIDRKSLRSYKEDQYLTVSQLLGNYNSSFATNYKVGYIPSPSIIGTQYGEVHSGLAIYARSEIKSSQRVSLPGNYKWPKKVFFLDRCFLASIIKTEQGKEILLINTHKSAYDKGGFLKKEQLEFIKQYAQKEYLKGRYVIIGGDWNSYMPGTDGKSFPSEEIAPDFYQSLPSNWTMPDWKWAVDKSGPTNRSLENPYVRGISFVSAIDGFLLSPNIEIVDVKTLDLDFQFSDHNPIELVVDLQ